MAVLRWRSTGLKRLSSGGGRVWTESLNAAKDVESRSRKQEPNALRPTRRPTRRPPTGSGAGDPEATGSRAAVGVKLKKERRR